MCDQFCAVKVQRCEKACEERVLYALILNSCFLTSSLSLIYTVSNGKSKGESGEPRVYVSAFTLRVPNFLFLYSLKVPRLFSPPYSMFILGLKCPFFFPTEHYLLLWWHFCVFVFPACDVSSMFAEAVLSTFEHSHISMVSVSRA